MQSREGAQERWQVIGRLAAESLGKANQRTFLFRKRRDDVTKTVQDFIALVYETDVANLDEDWFVSAQEILNDVIGSTENYLTSHVDHRDTGLIQFLGEAIRQLREARHWISQGYSPDAAKRPTDDERRKRAASRIASLPDDLFA